MVWVIRVQCPKVLTVAGCGLKRPTRALVTHRHPAPKPLNPAHAKTRVAHNLPRAPAPVAYPPALRATTRRGYAQHLFCTHAGAGGGY